MRRLLFVLSIIALLTLSCTRNSKDTALLGQVEACMDTYPDSALVLLRQINTPEKLHGQTRADYALLLTQAQDKNYLDSLQSDSLIGIAVDYYRNKDDKVKAGKAFLYYGKVMAIQRNDSAAMQYYQAAQKQLEGTKEYKMLGYIYNYIGILKDDWEMHDMAIEDYRKSISYFSKAHYTLGIIYAYRDIAWIYQTKPKEDSVRWYVQAGIDLLKGDSLSPVFPSFLQLFGEMEEAKGNYTKAAEYYEKAISKEKLPNSVHYYYMSLGNIYLKSGRFTQAEEFFKKVLKSHKSYTLADAYSCLSLLEKKRGDYAKAFLYYEKTDSLLNLSRNETVREKIITIQQKYESMNLQMKNEMLRLEKKMQWIVGGLLLVLIVGVGYWIRMKIKRNYKSLYKKHSKKYFNKLQRVVENNNQAIEQYLHQIEDLKQEKVQFSKESLLQVDTLEKRIKTLEAENNNIQNVFSPNAISVITCLRKHLLIQSNMNSSETNLFLEYMNLVFDGFATRLQREYKMNENTQIFVSLIKLGFSNEDLAFIFDTEIQAIWKRKQRLREKLALKEGENLEHFLNYYPRNVH